jgi:hypothetical protein
MPPQVREALVAALAEALVAWWQRSGNDTGGLH